ncbi:hypothetical protein Taro_011239, partial [Colocasia esculenta]|nr:hypothetical protein [Colocasia esculenta]
TVSPSRRTAQPEVRAGPDVSSPLPSSRVAGPLHDSADGATFSPYISLRVDSTSTVHAAPVEPLLGSLLSKDRNVEPELPAPGAREGHSREDDIDDWDYEVDVTDIPILNPDWDPSMENPEDPNFNMPFGDLMKMMEAPLATTNQGVLQEMTTATEPAMTETTPSLLVGATLDQGNLLPVSASTALNEEKGEPPAPSCHLPDPSVLPEETGFPARPSSQPCDSAIISQDGLLPTPELGEADGGDSSAPLPPALDLPAAVAEAEVPAKPSEYFSGNSGATSPLNASEPNSSGTQIISGEPSEATEPLSGETQRFSAAFETADGFEEVSSCPSLVVSGLERSSQALGVLEARLDALRSEVAGLTDQISVARAQHTSLLARQREGSARASLLHMLASHLDRSVAEDVRHSIALTIGLSSLEVERSRARAAITALEAEADLLRASDVGT